jgi:hypothetical protein
MLHCNIEATRIGWVNPSESALWDTFWTIEPDHDRHRIRQGEHHQLGPLDPRGGAQHRGLHGAGAEPVQETSGGTKKDLVEPA